MSNQRNHRIGWSLIVLWSGKINKSVEGPTIERTHLERVTFKGKRKARVTEKRAGAARERNLNGRRTGCSLELVGAGRLVWPTGADTRRKHTRRNVARFVASCIYRGTRAATDIRGHFHASIYAVVSSTGWPFHLWHGVLFSYDSF